MGVLAVRANLNLKRVLCGVQALSTISDSYYDAVVVTFVGNKVKACGVEGTPTHADQGLWKAGDSGRC